MGPVDPRSKSTSTLHQHCPSAPPTSSLVSPRGSDGVPRAVPGSIKRARPLLEYKGDSGRHPSDEAAAALASGDPGDPGLNLEDACIVRISGDEGVGPRSRRSPNGGQARNGAGEGPGAQTQ